MNNREIGIGLAGCVIGALVMLAFFPLRYGVQGMSMVWNGSFMRGDTMTGRTAVDQHFIEQMIPHHEDAITMAEIALEKAQHQEIKTLAQNIIEAQTRENIQMKP